MQPLEVENEYMISSHTAHAWIKVNPCYQKGPGVSRKE